MIMAKAGVAPALDKYDGDRSGELGRRRAYGYTSTSELTCSSPDQSVHETRA